MEHLIKLVSDKTGISREQAQTAVNTVIEFIKDKLPAGMQDQVNSLLSGNNPIDDIAGNMNKLGGNIR